MGTRSRTGLLLFVLFQAFYVVFASGWVYRAPDEFSVYFQTESLVDRGTLAVAQIPSSSFFGKYGGPRRDVPYAPYGPAAAFMAVPHHLIGRASASALGIDRARTPHAWFAVVSGLTSLATATAGALAVLGFFRAARGLGASEKRAAGLACVLGAGTVLWCYATSFYSEAFAAAAFVWAGVVLVEARDGKRSLAWASLLLAIAVLVKATNGVYALALALAPLAADLPREKRVRAAGVLLLGVVAAGLVHAEWNRHRFGNAFDWGYNWSETIRGEPRPFGANLLRGLAVLVLSPGKSVFAWAPAVALLALPRVRLLGKDRALLAGVAAPFLLGLVVFGKYMFVEGGYCHGPRHLVPIVPLLLLPAALGEKPRRAAVVASVLLGVGMNACGALASYLEDQAWGDRTRNVYYENVLDPGEGQPSNRYRLDYVPQVTLPVRIVESSRRLASGEPELPGTGLDLMTLHWRRARTAFPAPDGDAVPWGAGVVLTTGCMLLMGFAAHGLRRTLLRAENAAILGSPPSRGLEGEQRSGSKRA